MTKSVAIVNGGHEHGNMFIVFGPMTVFSVQTLVSQMLSARRKWEHEGRPKSGDFA